MNTGMTKEKIRLQFLIPKDNLRSVRRSKELTTTYAAGLIGTSRRQYELKEKGKYPFNDYEMLILSKELGRSVEYLFFNQ